MKTSTFWAFAKFSLTALIRRGRPSSHLWRLPGVSAVPMGKQLGIWMERSWSQHDGYFTNLPRSTDKISRSNTGIQPTDMGIRAYEATIVGKEIHCCRGSIGWSSVRTHVDWIIPTRRRVQIAQMQISKNLWVTCTGLNDAPIAMATPPVACWISSR